MTCGTSTCAWSSAISQQFVYQLVADLLLVIHLLFIVFAVLGGLLVLWRRWLAWLHLPAAFWAMLVEFTGWLCPLTPLEIRFRLAAGSDSFETSFIEHYLLPVIYPTGLTRELQIYLGLGVLVINLAIYGWVLRRVAKAHWRNPLD